jgi:hypothetical protein
MASHLDPVSLRPGHEEYAEFPSTLDEGNVCLYHYRRKNGELFTCVHYSLEECRSLRRAMARRPRRQDMHALADLIIE